MDEPGICESKLVHDVERTDEILMHTEPGTFSILRTSLIATVLRRCHTARPHALDIDARSQTSIYPDKLFAEMLSRSCKSDVARNGIDFEHKNTPREYV